MPAAHRFIENAIDITHLMPTGPTPYLTGSTDPPAGTTYLTGTLSEDDLASSESELAGARVHFYHIKTTERFILHWDAYFQVNTNQESDWDYAFGGLPAYYNEPFPRPYNGPYPIEYLGPERTRPGFVEVGIAVVWPKGAAADDTYWGPGVYNPTIGRYEYAHPGGNLVGLAPTDGSPVAINPGWDYYLYAYLPPGAPVDYEIQFGRRPVEDPWPLSADDSPQGTVMWVSPQFIYDEDDEFLRYYIWTYDPLNGQQVWRYLQDGDIWAYGVFATLGNYYEGVPLGYDGDSTFIYPYAYQINGEDYFQPPEMDVFEMYIVKGQEPAQPIPNTTIAWGSGALEDQDNQWRDIPEFIWFNRDTGNFVVQVEIGFSSPVLSWVEISTDGVILQTTANHLEEWVAYSQWEFTNPGPEVGFYNAWRLSADGTEKRFAEGFDSVYRTETSGMFTPSTIPPSHADPELYRYTLDDVLIETYTYPWMAGKDFRSVGIEDDGEHFWVQDRSYDVYGSYRHNSVPGSSFTKGIQSATNGYMYRLPCYEPTPERPEEPDCIAYSHLLIFGHGDLTDNLFLNWQPKSIMGTMFERRKSIWMGGEVKQIPVPERTFVVPST